jgi:hypothetical protein
MDATPATPRVEPSPSNNLPTSPLSSPPAGFLPTSPLSSPPPGFMDLEYMDVDFADDLLDEYGDDTTDPDTQQQYTIPSESQLSTAEKLQEVLLVLRKVHWTFPQFIRAWVGSGRDARVNPVEVISSKTYRTQEQRRSALNRTLDVLCHEDIYQPAVVSQMLLKALAQELDALVTECSYFGRFSGDEMGLEQLEQIDFKEAFRTIQGYAPMWSALLLRLLRNQRGHRASYTTSSDDETLPKRLFTITSIVCHSRAKLQSNFLSSLLDIYLLGCGTKRRVVETLSGLGLCHSYKQANRLIGRLAKECKVCVFLLSYRLLKTPANSCKLL